MKGIPGQIELFDYLGTLENKDDPVRIKKALNLKKHPIKDYEVTASYGDIVLIISMLRDYVKALDEVRRESLDWQAYYRAKFLKMADRLQSQIEYDYDKAMEKCRKKAEKESKSDIGEDALLLALKKDARNAAIKQQESTENK